MSQTDSPRVSATDLEEGDRVMLGINPHGSVDDLPGVEYYPDLYQSGAVGTVTDLPREQYLEMMDDGSRPMVDIKVEADDGTVYNWNVDNGYVLGPNESLGRRSDVGKIGGLYDPDTL